MYHDFKLIEGRPISIQVKDYMKRLMIKGALQPHQKLPSTRELSVLLGVSRNTVIAAYAELADEGRVYALQGKGNYVSEDSAGSAAPSSLSWQLPWKERLSRQALLAEELDLMKRGIRAGKSTISFTSIAPDEKLFDLDHVKQAFLGRMSVEGHVLLNYGYAKGYKPLIQYLMTYMENKGVDVQGKDMLITAGFTEGFDLVLAALRQKHGAVLCENPTHHTAIKNLKLHGFDIKGVAMEPDGIHLGELERALEERPYDCAYFVPSYHNPTGIVMSMEKRLALMQLMSRYEIPVIEDGFNEELRYSGAHVPPLIASAGSGNSVIYIGSFSKVLFPGLRVGWVLADRELIDYLESMKRARNIHTSTLDQSLLYQYLHNGNLHKYLKRARAEYKRKYELTLQACKAYVPYETLSGDGGLHLFVTFREACKVRELLEACSQQGVIFTLGHHFFTDGRGGNTLRLGFSRVADEDIVQGIRIIGDTAKQLWGLS
ncbi:GntR family transcriptional regulator [Paenibacillus sp. BIHB 4019]|uniref:GntR family transcriptional regulator n=1 Tax=Paenibacillus sp. BIHB 4019 TaxID=1870819 RepID=A0A1B2DFB4_9BACL|nr:PLP-dependent aminotransferase family protein [Paenibacillus sp. BIHB 4019]ANY66412.1 GntR family transcriptional regulator [Paenibacillus sp. BIHB 4019]